MNRTVAILGATGFVGTHLVLEFLRLGGYEIRVLTRPTMRDVTQRNFGLGVTVIDGDAVNPDSLRALLVPGCIVINLVYMWGAGEEANLACVRTLLAACKERKISRLVHTSTAAVVGRVKADRVNEATFCRPTDEYGFSKLKIEQAVTQFAKGEFDVAILRPTSVFGIGGEPLRKLVEDLTTGPRWKNYFRSCLFNNRSMHLVPLANVVAALIFLARYADQFDGDHIFIISSDEDPLNNFRAVELIGMKVLGIPDYHFPRMPVPLTALKLLLRFLGRSNTNPYRCFDSGKLRKFGYKDSVSLAEGLREYFLWCHRTLVR